jgi:hypothetical protein
MTTAQQDNRSMEIIQELAVQNTAMSISSWLLTDICNREEWKGIERGNYTKDDVLKVASMMEGTRYSGHGKRILRQYGTDC